MLDCFDTFHEKAYSEQGLTQGLVCCCLVQQTDQNFFRGIGKQFYINPQISRNHVITEKK